MKRQQEDKSPPRKSRDKDKAHTLALRTYHVMQGIPIKAARREQQRENGD